jgi:hypothetical protein
MLNDDDIIEMLCGEDQDYAKGKKKLVQLQKVFEEVEFLISSGYDGPFMGKPVENLFKAFLDKE